MRPTVNREREVEVDEARLTLILVASLLGLGCVLYFGVWIGTSMYARAAAPDLRLVAIAEAPVVVGRSSQPLPAGFIGPPPPPYPPPIGGGPGLGARALLSYGLEVEEFADAERADKSRRRLLGRGYPAYVIGSKGAAAAPFWLRIGDYATEAEADRTREVLRQHDGLSAAIVRRDGAGVTPGTSP